MLSKDDVSRIVCIGKNILLSGPDSDIFLDSIMVSYTGKVILMKSGDYGCTDIEPAVFRREFNGLCDIKTLDFDTLDDICQSYTYKLKGQSFRMVDLLAKNGMISFRDEYTFNRNIIRSLYRRSFVLLLMDSNSHMCYFNTSDVVFNQNDHCDFSGEIFNV